MPSAPGADPQRGYELLVGKAYLSPDFDEQAFAEVWKAWPEPLRSQAEQAGPAERRRMAFARYGLTPRPDGALGADGQLLPLQYVVSSQGVWTMNCFSCHGGTVLGKPTPGAPNTQYALQTLSEEMRSAKLQLQKPLTRMEVAATMMPLGTSRGTTNAVMFGVVLMSQRDAQLNFTPRLPIPPLPHHDMDPPAWWLFKRKTHIYADAYAQRSHRALMQFLLIRQNGPDKFAEWEPDAREIAAYLESIEPPRYPFAIDRALAGRGAALFSRHCAECHGSGGREGEYPNRIVPIETVGTDRVRLDAIPPDGRKNYGESWFGRFGEEETRNDPGGYLAPPLDGVWASAPYFHNGSVPTLWHLLHPAQRPAVWRRTSVEGYDQTKAGLVSEELGAVPAAVQDPRERREYFDTRQFGKGAGGHLFPDRLTEEEKQAVLEYLKTL